MNKYGLPPRQGLYDPRYEHDACGIGFVADIKGRPSQQIVQQGIEVLVNLEHRGACGCDPDTGDGAGLLLQIPHEFFVREADKLGFELPPRRRLRRRHAVRLQERERAGGRARVGASRRARRGPAACSAGARCRSTARRSAGWRARREPRIEQVFIGRDDGSTLDADAFERKLYIIRRRTFFAA